MDKQDKTNEYFEKDGKKIIEWIEYVYVKELYNSYHDRFVVVLYKNGKYSRMLKSNWLWIVSNNIHIPKWYVVHHIDKNHKNDILWNLTLVTRWEHNKLHSDDKNRFMFRKWHTYRNHAKSEEHKLKIKESHINRAKTESARVYNILFKEISDNPLLKLTEAMLLCWKQSHKFISRLLHTNFTSLKKEILWMN